MNKIGKMEAEIIEELMKDGSFWPSTTAALEKVLKLIKTKGWISVKEALPKEGTPCLVWIEEHKTAICCVYYNDFSLVKVDPVNGLGTHGVTHWQEIQPPEV